MLLSHIDVSLSSSLSEKTIKNIFLKKNRKDGSVTSSGGPPLPFPSLGNQVALGQFQYFRRY